MLNKLKNLVLRLLRPLLRQMGKPFVMGSVTLMIVLYAALAKPQLPGFMKDLMQSTIFRLVFIFLIAYTGDKNLSVSIIVAFAFMILFGLLAEIEVQEAFENTDVTENLENQLDALLEELDGATQGSVEAEPSMEGEM